MQDQNLGGDILNLSAVLKERAHDAPDTAAHDRFIKAIVPARPVQCLQFRSTLGRILAITQRLPRFTAAAACASTATGWKSVKFVSSSKSDCMTALPSPQAHARAGSANDHLVSEEVSTPFDPVGAIPQRMAMHKWLAIFSADSRTSEFYDDRFIDEVGFAIEGHMLVVLWRCGADEVQFLRRMFSMRTVAPSIPARLRGRTRASRRFRPGLGLKLDSERRAFDRINPHRVCFARMLEETSLSVHGRGRFYEIASALLLHRFIHQSVTSIRDCKEAISTAQRATVEIHGTRAMIPTPISSAAR